jgi:hypothetical protein
MSIDRDVEKAYLPSSDMSKLTSARRPYHIYVTPFDQVYGHQYRGEGTLDKPYIVDWLPNDFENPQTWSEKYKWMLTILVSAATLAISFCSSAYVGAFPGLMEEFDASVEVVTLGISVFVLGFAVGKFFF